ncbi:hypothetical protein L218DRAFT_993185 [Marasmius fiardii PR-910]|nr:hypothetical protein L218DRAFT_993185 [Marasmius fiardii PR-910]
MFTGRGPPPLTICRIQAALVSGVSPLVATAGLAAILQMWSNFHVLAPQYRCPLHGGKRLNPRVVSLLVCPYLVFLGFSVTSAFYAAHNPEHVKAPTRLYCTILTDALSRWSVPMYCIIVTALVIIVEAIVILQFWWARHEVDKATPLMKRENEVRTLIRLMLFNLGAMALLSSGIFYVVNAHISWPYMAQSAGNPEVVNRRFRIS